jgi:hypothetical protein
MRIAFEATEAGFDADEYALVCGVSSGTQSLTFQRDAEGSGEDWGVYLEYRDQSNGGYNCVRRCRLTREVLSVELSRQLGTLANVAGFGVTLGVDEESFRALRAGLLRVFRAMPGVLHLVQ